MRARLFPGLHLHRFIHVHLGLLDRSQQQYVYRVLIYADAFLMMRCLMSSHADVSFLSPDRGELILTFCLGTQADVWVRVL